MLSNCTVKSEHRRRYGQRLIHLEFLIWVTSKLLGCRCQILFFFSSISSVIRFFFFFCFHFPLCLGRRRFFLASVLYLNHIWPNFRHFLRNISLAADLPFTILAGFLTDNCGKIIQLFFFPQNFVVNLYWSKTSWILIY